MKLRIQDKTVFQKSEFWIACIVLVATGFIVFPVLDWIASITLSKEQIQHPFIVLCLSAFLIVQHHRLKFVFSLETNDLLIRLLVLCYILIAAASLIPLPLLSALPLVIYSGALILFIFGKRHFTLAVPLLVAFTVFLAFAIYIPYADWPLRQLAGQAASFALTLLGFDTNLAVKVSNQEVQLLMQVGSQIFHVAPECNGYGILSSTLLLTVIASLALKNGAFRTLAAIPLNLAIAFVINILRIIVITQLAPYFIDNYMTMHEAAGISALILGLYLSWRVCLTLKRPPSAQQA